MGGASIPQDGQSILIPGLLNVTVSSEISTCRIVVDEIVLRQEALGANVVSSGEMDLSKEEGIVRFIF